MQKQRLDPRPERGVGPGAVLHAPWRASGERPWFRRPLFLEIRPVAMKNAVSWLLFVFVVSPCWAYDVIEIDGANSAVQTWGPGNASFGQSFVPLTGDSLLSDFSLYLNAEGPPSFGFHSYIYAWNGTATTGPALYTSPVTTLAYNNPGVLPYTFYPEITLNSGASYIAIISSQGIAGSGGGDASGNPFDPYPNGGLFVTQENFTSGDWSSVAGYDLQFRADFQSVPEPSSAVLAAIGSALCGLYRVTLSRRSREGASEA
jgi:hypothetical protein